MHVAQHICAAQRGAWELGAELASMQSDLSLKLIVCKDFVQVIMRIANGKKAMPETAPIPNRPQPKQQGVSCS